MLRTGRRRLVFLLTPLATTISSILGLYLKVYGQSTSWRVVGGLVLILISSAFLASYFTHVRPVRDASTVGRLLLDHVGQRIAKYCQDKGVSIRLNALILYRPARFLFLARRFKARWSLGMHQADAGTEFGIKKGVSGQVFKSGNSVAVDMEESRNRDPRTWKFTERDLRRLKFPGHTLIWSFPVFELNRENYPTGRILGTLNLDSLQKGAFQALVRDDVVRTELEDMMEQLQDMVSRVASC